MAKTIINVRGVTIYPHLNEPDTKFNAEGEYHTKLRISAEEQAKIVAACDPMRDAEMAKQRDNPSNKDKKLQLADYAIEPEYDEDENETGNFIIRPKMKRTGKNRKTGETFTRRLPLFDSAEPPQPTNVKVGGGSEVEVALELFPYAMAGKEKVRGKILKNVGVSLKLAAVQIIELRQGGGSSNDAGSFGFGGGSGGFVASGDGDAPSGSDDDDSAGDAEAGDDSADYDFT